MKSTNELYPNSIITPEIVKIWDDTWDCIVNENFIDKKVNYQKTMTHIKIVVSRVILSHCWCK